MKTQASSNLSKSIAQYSAMALALNGSTNVLGQIVYTDVDPDITGTFYNLNTNNDNTNDFQIQMVFPWGNIVYLQTLNTNSFMGTENGYNWISTTPLDIGQAISSGQNWFQGNGFIAGGYSTSIATPNKYVGLRFKLGSNTHYGWVRLDVNANNITIKDYAYNTTPGESINAGQTTLSIEDFNLKEIKIVSKNSVIELYNLRESLDYKMFSITGQIVLDGKTEENTYTIQTNRLTKGIYVIELLDKRSKSTLRKKIVI
ncbi:T9SS type A sorting domain-containing protein [Mangrovimonas sp. DI 80]|uniref:T9SS type A sorting domain-containing protein n=1 Tax=Mangrovimonas sp. DI 80 TaxID=1779330 RepID=UPI000976E72B|nr:T9SS type A sorting domain-containing protein [Mangrovimonas sp. DI 80]OMP30591.1 hypothetical protein BKM32_10085 [Mangrovimonas sp. DI 80]